MTYKFVFRIRKCYFDKIVTGEKTVEYRRDNEFWQKRLDTCCRNLHLPLTYPLANTEITFSTEFFKTDNIQAIFICGKCIHIRRVMKIERTPTPTGFSEQGKKDVDTSTCLAFHLGAEVLPLTKKPLGGGA